MRRKFLVLCILLVCAAMTAHTDASVDDHQDCLDACDADKAQCIADAALAGELVAETQKLLAMSWLRVYKHV